MYILKTQLEKEEFAIDLINSFAGNVTHAINCVDRMIAVAPFTSEKEELTQIKTMIANQGDILKRKAIRVVKKKQLLQEHRVLESWQVFLGLNYSVKATVLSSSTNSDLWQSKPYNPDNKSDGVLCLEYHNILTNQSGSLLEGEWLYQINDKIEHLTEYVMANYPRFYDNDLNSLIK